MKQRPLVICVIAFLIGILLSFYGFSGLITFLAIMTICSAYFIKKNKLKFGVILLVVLLLGAGRMGLAQFKRESVITKNTGKEGKMTLVITEPSTDGRAVARLKTPDGNIKVYLVVDKRCEFSAGDIVTGEILLHRPLETRFGARAFSNYLASRDVFLQASCDEVSVKGTYKKGVMGKIYALRAYANKLGRTYFGNDDRALFNAVVFGDKSLMSDELYAALQGSGLNHIAVVSGMHLSVIIAFLIYIIEKTLGKGRRGFFIVIASAVFITLVTGAGASIVRALIMCLIYYLSRILYREKDGATSLFCTIWIMTIANPYILFNTGFILSVFAVLGLILYSTKFKGVFRRFMPEKVAEGMSLTIASQIALVPIIVCYFGVITPYAPFSNIIAVPLSSVFVILGMILVLVSPIKPIAMIISSVMKVFSGAIINLCKGVSSLPGALIYCGEEVLLFSAIWIFLAVIIFYYPIPPAKFKRFAAVFCIAGVVATYFSRIEYDKIIFTPCGKSTLSYIESGESSFLIDCPDVFGISSLGDASKEIVITRNTYQDTFAIKGVPRKVYIPSAVLSENKKKEIIRKAEASGATVIFKTDGEIFRTGNATLRYIDAGVTDTRAVEINLSGKRIITLQGFSRNEIEEMICDRKAFVCDYLYSPYQIEGIEALSTGEIISNNKFLLKR